MKNHHVGDPGLAPILLQEIMSSSPSPLRDKPLKQSGRLDSLALLPAARRVVGLAACRSIFVRFAANRSKFFVIYDLLYTRISFAWSNSQSTFLETQAKY
jgi:hypothetical protein